MLGLETDPSHFRAGFVETCLAQAPPAARPWYKKLCALTQAEILPAAAAVDRDAAYPVDAIAALRNIGALGITVTEQHAGLGFSDAVAALAVETVAAACPSTAAVLMFHYQVVRRVALFGSPPWQADDLRKLATGRWLASSAWTEQGAGADKASLATRLDHQGGQIKVNGAKHFCTGLEGASLIHVLLDAAPKGSKPAPTFARIQTDKEGVDCSEIYPLLGLRGSSTGTVRLHDVMLDDDCLVGRVGQGAALMRANHEFLMNPGLIALGVARSSFECARDAALGRMPGTRDISGYQATRFRLAEMLSMLERSYALAADSVRLGTGTARASDFLRVKLAASEAAVAVSSSALRLAGGRGFHTDWPHERHLRDAYATVLMGPTNEIIKERIAEQLFTDSVSESDFTQQRLGSA